jgi:hypothetical protein
MFISLSLIGCTYTLNTQGIETVTLQQFTDNGEKYAKNLFQDKQGLIIKIPANTSVPIELQLDVPFANFIQGKNYIKFKSDTYLYFHLNKIMVSADKIKWAPIHDISSIKEIYNMKKGSISLSFAATKEKGAYINVTIASENK